MHILAAQEILAGCRGRSNRKEAVTKENAPHSPETYEDCIIELGHERDIAPKETLTALAEAVRKVCPDVIPRITEAWEDYQRKVASRDEAFNSLLAALQK